MKLESFLISDAATDQNGKLNILGAFDTIGTTTIPSIHPQCSLSLRIRFNKSEVGSYKLKISILTSSNAKVLESIIDFNILLKEGLESGIANMVFNIRDLKCIEFGKQIVYAYVNDKELGTVEYYVNKIGA